VCFSPMVSSMSGNGSVIASFVKRKGNTKDVKLKLSLLRATLSHIILYF